MVFHTNSDSLMIQQINKAIRLITCYFRSISFEFAFNYRQTSLYKSYFQPPFI